MKTIVESFGRDKEGTEVFLYTMENKNGMKAAVTNFGAILVKLIVPTLKLGYKDVVLGFDSVEGYLDDGNCFGATVGPIANRTANAEFTIDTITYKLEKNRSEERRVGKEC